jgi:prepilin-type N-terminal cleavage/methylation domain-containing protein
MHRTERGTSLIEVMVAVMIMAIVGPIAASVMVSTLRAGTASEDQSRVVDELRLQMYAVSRELRSASCVIIPTTASQAGDTLRFSTESQTGAASNTLYLQYQVTGSQLVRTQYTDAQFTTVSGTRYVGPGLVSPATTFTLYSTPRKSVLIDLRLQLTSNRPVQRLTTTIAGRNAWGTACIP